ncbi:TetR/AcrR family transcriptional regulator [Novosphingobium sp. PY1]|uniref:TetR/AcrR family transcriptional regulator n=1 Tax=Novosphingobium sp. PY1 TaxID=1882221 RepID=UPI001A8D1DB2|nr:TetR/AcrR family transcriptional regulator [Novosphingobium sp. PY1]GFM27609.1 TetR family transcriptional regulator [Novosphingobium sp. PY1]
MARAKSYHKKDLRRDLLNAGREFVSRNGHSSLSLRGLAQQVGVTTAAPYHHFSDRRALLLALALEGFEELIGGAQAVDTANLSPLDQLINMGQAFLEFAYSQPRMMELMYESELTNPTVDPVLLEYQQKGYKALLGAVTKAMPDAPFDDRSMRVMGYWSTIYGLALLRNKQLIQPYDPLSRAPRDIDHALVARSARAALDA